VQAACEFLEGQTGEFEKQIEEEMRKAAAAQDFEKAAQLRDALNDLRKTTKRTGKFPRIPYTLPVSINPESDVRELCRELGLSSPPDRIEGFDISNISGTFAVASMVSFWRGRPDRSNYRRFKMKTVAGQDDFACMAETVKRRYSRLVSESKIRSQKSKVEEENQETESKIENPESNLPDLILIDGGKGQLNAACLELEKLGLSNIPIIGLAKEFEEIYRPGESEHTCATLWRPFQAILPL
jgi:excinuclease ABC subunit C